MLPWHYILLLKCCLFWSHILPLSKKLEVFAANIKICTLPHQGNISVTCAALAPAEKCAHIGSNVEKRQTTQYFEKGDIRGVSGLC